jgi:phosphoserine phosphatase
VGRFPFRLVTLDIDGTLTTEHGWWAVARRTGREDEYRSTQDRFFTGQIGEDEHLQDLLALADGLLLAEMEGLLEATGKIGGLGEGIAELQTGGVRVALLTHNPGYVCDWYRMRFALDDAEGCDAAPPRGGRIGPPGPVHADKRGGLRRLLARNLVNPIEVAHVGDGWADMSVFRCTGGSIALNSRLPEVDASATLALHTQDFAEVVRALAVMGSRSPVNDVSSSLEGLNT